MVSNLDTEGSLQPQNTAEYYFIDQSEDEILDYLMGSSSKNPVKNDFSCLKQDIDKKQSQISKLIENNKMLERVQKPLVKNLSSLAKSASEVIATTAMVTIKLVTKAYNSKPAKIATKKIKDLNNVEINVIKKDLNFNEAINKLQKVYPQIKPQLDLLLDKLDDIQPEIIKYKPTFIKIISIINDKLSTVKNYSMEFFYQAGVQIIKLFPRYSRAFISSSILIAYSFMALFTQIAFATIEDKTTKTSNSTDKLKAANWKVNGQINQNEKDYVLNLISSGKIKVLPNKNINSSKIKLITTTTNTSHTDASPDSAFLLISSNSINHNVNDGESILSISQKYKVSISDLISANPDKDLISLKSEDKVIVPVTSEVNKATRPSNFYGRIPRSLIASRSISSSSRNFSSPTASMLWPVPSSSKISSRYGPRWGGFHPGIDITAPIGTPIVATRDGVVISSGWAGGYGKCVIIDHGNGISTRYAHASSLLVQQGQHVKAGQIVVKMGSTGWSTGSHLHYEVLINGRHHNPLRYL